ncbi:MAG: hypothetical protein COY40_04940, partial [Alphaproteobacteria bacterium CG_4_10_14_0_8_um_filter_53_9]
MEQSELKIRARIRKLDLLAANNPNPHEAESARIKAQRLREQIGDQPKPSYSGTIMPGARERVMDEIARRMREQGRPQQMWPSEEVIRGRSEEFMKMF